MIYYRKKKIQADFPLFFAVSGIKKGVQAVLTFIVLVSFTTPGCTLFDPKNLRPEPENIPQTYSFYSQEGEPPEKWWTSFKSPELNQWVDTALNEGFTIRKAWARLEQAEATAKKQGAARLPGLNAIAGAEHSRSWTGTEKGSTLNRSDDFSFGLAASFELDLWGRVKSQTQSAGLLAMASRSDLHAAAVSVAGEVTATWLDLILVAEEIEVVKKQLSTNQDILYVLDLRVLHGQASLLDILQQQEVIAATKALLPPLYATQSTLQTKLAILTGQPPGQQFSLAETFLPDLPPVPATGLPAELLAARPDIQAAGLRLESSQWTIAAAKADRLPNITLSATGTYGATSLDDIFDSWIAQLAGNLLFPLFDGGSRSAELERTKAVAKERLAEYEETVFTAIKEVEDALVAEIRQGEKYIATKKQLEAARMGLAEAQRRYLAGIDDFLPTLQAINSVQSLERSLLAEQATLLNNRVALYRALGGNWPKELVQKEMQDNL